LRGIDLYDGLIYAEAKSPDLPVIKDDGAIHESGCFVPVGIKCANPNVEFFLGEIPALLRLGSGSNPTES
jgi:hypothetical protein